MDEEPDILFQIGSNILRALYKAHREDVYYWEKVTSLMALGDFKSFNVLLHVYSTNDSLVLSVQDVDLVLEIFKRHHPENEFLLSVTLIKILQVDKKRGLDAIKSFLADTATVAAVNSFYSCHKKHPTITKSAGILY